MRIFVLSCLVLAQLAGAAEKKGHTTRESETVKVTVSTKRVGTYTAGCNPNYCAVYAKVENLSDQALPLDLSAVVLRTVEGRALQMLDEVAATRTMSGLFGSFLSRSLGPDHVRQNLLHSGSIPAKSFVEGILCFQGPGGSRKKPQEILMTPILPDPIPLTW